FAGIANDVAGGAAFHPTLQLAWNSIPKDRLHAELPDPLQGLPECVETAEPLELQLAESHIWNIGGPFDIVQPADRLIQHNWNGGYFRDTGIRVPIVGIAWLFEQLDASGIEG